MDVYLAGCGGRGEGPWAGGGERGLSRFRAFMW